MEFKTLKDLKFYREMDVVHLRQEAIKFCKECWKYILDHKKQDDIIFDNRTQTFGEWVAIIQDKRHFFNISDEDLK